MVTFLRGISSDEFGGMSRQFVGVTKGAPGMVTVVIIVDVALFVTVTVDILVVVDV